MQATLRANVAKSLTISSSYTWSHAIDMVDGELFANISNPYNAKYDHGSAGFDRRQMLVTSFVYNMPFFKHSARTTKALLSGWEISGVANMVSGSPLSIGGGTDNLGLGGQTNNRANVTAPITYDKTRFSWFSGSSFAKPAALQWGTSAKDLVVGPGRNNWNLAMFKAFQFTERAKFEFRAETFNTFNHTQWSNPSTGIEQQSSFGTINGTNPARVMQLGAKFQF